MLFSPFLGICSKMRLGHGSVYYPFQAPMLLFHYPKQGMTDTCYSIGHYGQLSGDDLNRLERMLVSLAETNKNFPGAIQVKNNATILLSVFL